MAVSLSKIKKERKEVWRGDQSATTGTERVTGLVELYTIGQRAQTETIIGVSEGNFQRRFLDMRRLIKCIRREGGGRLFIPRVYFEFINPGRAAAGPPLIRGEVTKRMAGDK